MFEFVFPCRQALRVNVAGLSGSGSGPARSRTAESGLGKPATGFQQSEKFQLQV